MNEIDDSDEADPFVTSTSRGTRGRHARTSRGDFDEIMSDSPDVAPRRTRKGKERATDDFTDDAVDSDYLRLSDDPESPPRRSSQRTAGAPSRRMTRGRQSRSSAASDDSDLDGLEVPSGPPSDFDAPAASVRSRRPGSGGLKRPRPKLVVSKKDYEDLAQYIVDNIAEGDIPTSRDFEQLSKDVCGFIPRSTTC